MRTLVVLHLLLLLLVLLASVVSGQDQVDPRPLPSAMQSPERAPVFTWQGGHVWSPTIQPHQWQQQYVPTNRYRCARCGRYHVTYPYHVLQVGPFVWWW